MRNTHPCPQRASPHGRRARSPVHTHTRASLACILSLGDPPLCVILYQDHVKRGGKLITAPQTALYDPKVIDNVNITVLIRQCMVGE